MRCAPVWPHQEDGMRTAQKHTGNPSDKHLMIVTHAWHPQVSGVVTNLKNVKLKLEQRGYTVGMIVPDHKKYHIRYWLPGHPTIPLSLVPKWGKIWVRDELHELRKQGRLDHIYIATPEGPLGHAAVKYC